jgi:hypothetical protein
MYRQKREKKRALLAAPAPDPETLAAVFDPPLGSVQGRN